MMPLTRATKAWLEATFSTNFVKSDCKKKVEKFGVSDCNDIRCRMRPSQAIKAYWFLSRLHQFWLYEVTSLTAVFEVWIWEN